MPSSTSSFEPRVVPEGPWIRTWALGLVVFVIAIAAVESMWRRRGLIPTVVDDKDLWAYERNQVYAPRTLVLVGGSRFECDVDTAVLRARFPWLHIVQLSVQGATPVATFMDLAKDDRFHDASVFVDVAEHALEKAYWRDQAPLVAHFHQRTSLVADLEVKSALFLQSHLVVANPYVGFSNLVTRGIPTRSYITTMPDRSRRADYSLVDRQKALQARIDRLKRDPPAPDPAAWLEQALEMNDYVHRLKARRVKTAFIRPPTTGEHWEIDAKRYPKDKYWDVFKARVDAPAIHFEDEPTLDQFEAPDGSHLDESDTPLFTECLADLIVRIGLVKPEPGAPASRCVRRGH